MDIPGIWPAQIDFGESPLDGIIAYLTREFGGNVCETGRVTATASSCFNGLVQHIADLETKWHFQTDDSPNSWICYDFKALRVAPTSYSIRTSSWGFLRSWVFEVSNDGNEWHVVDRRENSEDLKGAFVTRNFSVSVPVHGSFRFVRLRQTGKNHGGSEGSPDDTLIVIALEVFGTLSL